MVNPSKGVLLVSFLAVAFVLAASFASAQGGPGSFTVSVKAINDSILLDGQAILELTVNNPNNYADTFRISVSDIEWSVQSDPLHHYFSGVDISPFSSQKVRLLLKPTVAFQPGYRNVVIDVKSVKGGQSLQLSGFINIRSNRQLIQEYLAAVSRIVEIPSQIDPREEFAIKVNLLNRNPKNISNLRVHLKSVSNDLISEEIYTTLLPLESKSVSTKVKLDSITPPAKDTLRVVLYVDDLSLEPTIFEKFDVISYSEIRAVSSERKGSLFKWVNETTYVNDGNVRSGRVIESRKNLFKSFFTSSKPSSYTISKGGNRYEAWELSLGPQESVTVREVESYRPILYVLLLGLLGFGAYRFFRSPIRMVKEASAISYKEGGISELKVVLRVRNTSSQPHVKLTVMDTVPMIAEVEHDSMGTLKPATVFNSGKGSVVKWELENLDKHEERILAYKIRSKLSILGTFTLPRASLRFYTEKNIKFATRSNAVIIKP